MSDYIIDVQRQSPQIDILNISWDDYSKIMRSLESIIDLLKNNNLNDDIYHERYRKSILTEYEDLRDQLTSSEFSSTGQAVSIEDTVIYKLQEIKNQP